jgi:hypothetical protein
MTSRREALPDTSRLAKFLLLLGSDKPGEVCAAATALCRTLKSSGHDLHDLVSALNGRPSSIATRSSRKQKSSIRKSRIYRRARSRSCVSIKTRRV